MSTPTPVALRERIMAAIEFAKASSSVPSVTVMLTEDAKALLAALDAAERARQLPERGWSICEAHSTAIALCAQCDVDTLPTLPDDIDADELEGIRLGLNDARAGRVRSLDSIRAALQREDAAVPQSDTVTAQAETIRQLIAEMRGVAEELGDCCAGAPPSIIESWADKLDAALTARPEAGAKKEL